MLHVPVAICLLWKYLPLALLRILRLPQIFCRIGLLLISCSPSSRCFEMDAFSLPPEHTRPCAGTLPFAFPRPESNVKVVVSLWPTDSADFFFLFRAAPAAYGGSQARGLTGAVAPVLRHSHSKAGSEPCLWFTPQFMAMSDLYLLSETRDWTCNLMVPSRNRFRCAIGMGTPSQLFEYAY